LGAACAGETGRTGASSVPPREADAAGVMRVSGTPLNGAGAGSSSNTKGAGRALEGKIVEWVSGVRLSRDGGIISAQEIEIQLLHSRERFIVRRLFFNRLLRGRRFFHRYILRLKARAGKEVRRRHKNTAFSKFKAGRKTPASPDAAFQLWHYFTASRTHTQARRAKKPLFSAKYEEFLNFPKRDLQFSAVWCMLN